MEDWSLTDWSLIDWSLTANGGGGGSPRFRKSSKSKLPASGLLHDEDDEDVALILFALSR